MNWDAVALQVRRYQLKVRGWPEVRLDADEWVEAAMSFFAPVAIPGVEAFTAMGVIWSLRR
jgi:hypothetical protein